MTEFDYSSCEEAPSDASFAVLYDMVADLADTECKIAEAEKLLKGLNAKALEISTRTLPEKMDELGMREVTLRNGMTIKIKKEIHCSLPKGKPELYERGLKWFIDNGLGKIIKNQLVAEFGKGKEAEAEALAARLRDENYLVQTIKEVHPQTIKAVIKGWLEQGGEDEEADEIFSIHRVDVAKIK